MGEK
jgi:processing peptidase subunit beta